MARIDEGFQQPQRVAEPRRPILRQAAFAQRQDARAKVRIVVFWQNQEARVVGDQMQAIILMAKIPADPVIPGRALQGRGGEAQQGQPLAAPSGDIPQGVANLRQRAQVVMGLHQ